MHFSGRLLSHCRKARPRWWLPRGQRRRRGVWTCKCSRKAMAAVPAGVKVVAVGYSSRAALTSARPTRAHPQRSGPRRAPPPRSRTRGTLAQSVRGAVGHHTRIRPISHGTLRERECEAT
eukprot:1860229-Prymnesium_polylepis.2